VIEPLALTIGDARVPAEVRAHAIGGLAVLAQRPGEPLPFARIAIDAHFTIADDPIDAAEELLDPGRR
jgi:hypothetical protein